jgi:hypothetical protein
MDWITPVLKLSLALVMNPIHGVETTGGHIELVNMPNHYAEVDATVGVLLWDHWGVEGDIRVSMLPPWVINDGEPWFAPFQTDFIFRTFLEFGPVQFGFEHLCTHPNLTYGVNTDRMYGGVNKIYLTFEPEFK